jgi:hypothetical protein
LRSIEQGQTFDVTLLIKDVLDEFNRLDTLTIRQTLRNGGLGKYGRTQTINAKVCYWIRDILNQLNKIDYKKKL